MEFRLTYQGRLRAASGRENRTDEKHQIRKQLHVQLKHLWQVQTPFSKWVTRRTGPVVGDSTSLAEGRPPEARGPTVLEVIANNYARYGYRFVPVVTRERSLTCALDILFLRRDEPGMLVQSGGDIDNRIKVLFDALRMPSQPQEVEGLPVAEGEDPFFVLLEDDSQITDISVTTDRLLTPPGPGEHVNDVHLVIAVRVKVSKVDTSLSNLEFL